MGNEHGQDQGRSHDKRDDDWNSSTHILLQTLESQGKETDDEIAGLGDGFAEP